MRKAFGALIMLTGAAIIPASFFGFVWLLGMACAFGSTSGSCPPADFASGEALTVFWLPSAVGILLIILGRRIFRGPRPRPGKTL